MFKVDCLNQVNIMHHVSLQNTWTVQLGSPSQHCETQQLSVSQKAGVAVSGYKAINDELGLQPLLSQSSFTSSRGHWQREQAWQHDCMKLLPSHILDLPSLSNYLSMDWRRLLSFSWLWSTLMISIPCSLIFSILRWTPIQLSSLSFPSTKPSVGVPPQYGTITFSLLSTHAQKEAFTHVKAVQHHDHQCGTLQIWKTCSVLNFLFREISDGFISTYRYSCIA